MCDVCKEEDLFVELVGLLGSTNTEVCCPLSDCLRRISSKNL